jgi:hypothetical protein
MSIKYRLIFALFFTISLFTPYLCAQTSGIEVKIIGASYFEAPPNRDKNLAIFATGQSQEKVEIYAIATSKNKRFSEFSLSVFEKADIKVTAILANKASLLLGSAEIGSFPKISTDGKSRQISFSMTRLPDQPLQGLVFEGTIPLTLAKGLVKTTSKFEPTVGTQIKLNDIAASIAKIDSQTITLKGNDGLARLYSLSLKLADGRNVMAERRSWGRMNNETTQDWAFASPLGTGTIQAEVYDGLETVQQPIRLIVGKPY